MDEGALCNEEPSPGARLRLGALCLRRDNADEGQQSHETGHRSKASHPTSPRWRGRSPSVVVSPPVK